MLVNNGLRIIKRTITQKFVSIQLQSDSMSHNYSKESET